MRAGRVCLVYTRLLPALRDGRGRCKARLDRPGIERTRRNIPEQVLLARFRRRLDRSCPCDAGGGSVALDFFRFATEQAGDQLDHPIVQHKEVDAADEGRPTRKLPDRSDHPQRSPETQ